MPELNAIDKKGETSADPAAYFSLGKLGGNYCGDTYAAAATTTTTLS